ncbi:MAG: ribosomal small subunit protein bTHX [Bacteroidetes bacterium GWA2_31_9b]|nr:MAG: ribosomal small subunit protein bTHX [Bacteroidetes bacterium GWA2_31_9b]
MGKGDKKTRKGKIVIGSHGVRRPKRKKTKAAAPSVKPKTPVKTEPKVKAESKAKVKTEIKETPKPKKTTKKKVDE